LVRDEFGKVSLLGHTLRMISTIKTEIRDIFGRFYIFVCTKVHPLRMICHGQGLLSSIDCVRVATAHDGFFSEVGAHVSQNLDLSLGPLDYAIMDSFVERLLTTINGTFHPIVIEKDTGSKVEPDRYIYQPRKGNCTLLRVPKKIYNVIRGIQKKVYQLSSHQPSPWVPVWTLAPPRLFP